MIYCAFDPLNIPKDPNTNEDIHVCKNYGSFLCAKGPRNIWSLTLVSINWRKK